MQELRRCKSRELRGGIFYTHCDCIKRNGLQDDCRRSECMGRTECLIQPIPRCCPGQMAHGKLNILKSKLCDIGDTGCAPVCISTSYTPRSTPCHVPCVGPSCSINEPPGLPSHCSSGSCYSCAGSCDPPYSPYEPGQLSKTCTSLDPSDPPTGPYETHGPPCLPAGPCAPPCPTSLSYLDCKECPLFDISFTSGPRCPPAGTCCVRHCFTSPSGQCPPIRTCASGSPCCQQYPPTGSYSSSFQTPHSSCLHDLIPPDEPGPRACRISPECTFCRL